jgi:aspartate/tyrosine/aromatic aminotransferase
MSFFENYEPAKTDPIFGLNAILKADPRPEKIDLLIGYYKDEKGHVPIFNAVGEAQKILFSKTKDLNYLPIDGSHSFISELKSLIFDPIYDDFIYGAQTVGGTSALHHLGKMVTLKKGQSIAIPDPTWANHHQIFSYLDLKIETYPYYDKKSHKLLWEEFLSFLNKLSAGDVLLLHASCHNPSGLDFTNEQLRQIAQIANQKKLLPFFDCAYQGFGDGLEQDVQSIKIFCEEVDEFMLAYSCSKNFGLYGERTGACFFYSKDKKIKDILASILKQSIRATYSNPPRNGALIVSEILKSDKLTQDWKEELLSYKKRMQDFRKRIHHALEKLTGNDFSYVSKGKGLFVFTGLSESQVIALQKNEAIYLSSDGRMNITGLNHDNFDTVMEAISGYL